MSKRVAFGFLHGFMAGNPDASLAITVDGNEESITLTKGPAIHGWCTDDTKIVTDDGETTVKDENIRQMQMLLTQWVRGEEITL